MKKIIFLVILLTLSSCSSSKKKSQYKIFNPDLNCSTEAIILNNKVDEVYDKNMTRYEHDRLEERGMDFLLDKEVDLKSCYQEYRDLGGTKEFNVCLAVILNAKAVIELADASDEVGKLDTNLKACLDKKLASYDYKNLKAIYGTKIIKGLFLTLPKK